MRHVTRVTAFLAGLLLSAGAAWAQSSPSHFPAATQPLTGADAVLMDQGSGCASGIQPCATKNSPSTRVGQPVQQTTAPTAPFAYQQWIDTSLSPPQLKMRIGSSWFTVASLSSTAGVGFNVPASAVTGLGTIATQNANAVAITGGTITGMPTPTVNSGVATKAYVDGKASGIVFQQSVDYATAAILPNTPTYANGTLGVGRTLTAGGNSTITVDGTVAALTKRVLVKNQSDQTQNGCYSVTTAGSGAAPWVLTGCTDWDQSAEMQTGSYFIVTAGATNASTSWVLNTSGAVTVGSTPLAFVQSGASNIYTAGTGLTLGGAVFSITNTGVAAATYGSATQSGQFSVNAQGQITTASNLAISIPASSLTNGTTGSGAVMLAISPTSTGTFTAAAISSNSVNTEAYLLGGTYFAVYAGVYQVLLDRAGNQPVILGSASDPTNYYRNTTHTFGNIGGGVSYATINSAGLGVAGVITSTGLMTAGAGLNVTGALGVSDSLNVTNGIVGGTVTGTTSITTALYKINGANFATSDGTRRILYDESAREAIFLGGVADPNNLYRNGGHYFQNVGGGVNYFTITNTRITSTVDAYKPGGGSWADSSDERLKTNLVTGFDAMAKLRLLKPTLFDWKNPEAHGRLAGLAGDPAHGGFLAEEFKGVFPEFVRENDCEAADCAAVGGGKVYSITLPFKFDAYMIRALQQLDARLKAGGL